MSIEIAFSLLGHREDSCRLALLFGTYLTLRSHRHWGAQGASSFFIGLGCHCHTFIMRLMLKRTSLYGEYVI